MNPDFFITNVTVSIQTLGILETNKAFKIVLFVILIFYGLPKLTYAMHFLMMLYSWVELIVFYARI